MSVSSGFSYSVEDVNVSVRKTNTLLRAANAIRLSVRDLQQVWESPNLSRIMWTLVQLSRTYNALRRLHRLIIVEANISSIIMGLVSRIIAPPEPRAAPTVVPTLDLSALSVRVSAFRENLPMGLEGIDLTDLPENTRVMLQAILEDDAEITVNDAREILMSQAKNPTGNLAASIGWMSEVFGTRINANAYYAWWVEEGHKFPSGAEFEGYHYLREAVNRARIRLPERIKYELNGLILGDT